MARAYLLLFLASLLSAQTWLETQSTRIGETEVVREQFHLQGIPVWGEEAVRVRTPRGGAERFETGRLAQRRQPATPVAFGAITESQALETARAKLNWPTARLHTIDRWFKADRNGVLHGVWRVILTRGIREVQRVLVDSDTGAVLETFNLIQRQTAQGLVFPRSPISSPLTQAPLPGITSNLLNGPNVRVFNFLPVLFEIVPFENLLSTQTQLARADANGNFLYPPDDPRFSEVQAYYGIARAASYLRSLGYNGLNRQFDVIVQFIDPESPYDVNAFFSPTLFDNRGGIVMQTNLLSADTTLDSSILFHEYGHAMVHAIVNSLNSSNQFRAVNEAFADYFAASFFNNPAIGEFFPILSPSPNFLTRQAFLRNIENQTRYPDSVQGQPHADSLMFSAALWDIRRTQGQQRADLIAINGLARMSSQMGFYSAAQALVTAANSLYGNSVRDQVAQIVANRGLTSPAALYAEDSFPLESGVTRVSRIPARPANTSVLLAPDDFRIEVPLGSSQMRVQVQATGNVRTFIRFRAPVDIEGGSVISEYVLGDGTSLDGAVTFNSTPELQAGEYYFNVANLTTNEVEYAIRVTLTEDPQGLAGSFPVLQPGIVATGAVPVNFLNTRQFRFVIPPGATGADIELSGDQDVDLYVNHGQPVTTGGEGLPLAEGISASAANSERMLLTTATLPNLRPGTYFIGVLNYSRSAPARFSLRATLRNEAAYAPSPDLTPPNEVRNLFLPASFNTGILLTRQFRIDTQAGWQGLNLRVTSNSSALMLIRRNQPVRFEEGVPQADFRVLVRNQTRAFALDRNSQPAFEPGVYYVAFLSFSERGGSLSFDYAPIGAAGAAPVISGVVEGAGFSPQISPGSWVTITGSALAPTTRIWGAADFLGNALPTTLDGTSVTIGGVPAFIYFISPGQLNVLAPQSLPTGNLPVVVTTRTGRSNSVTVQSVAALPSLFRFDPQGRRYAAAVLPNGTYVGPPGLFGAALATRPVARGEIVQLFATGLGPVGPVDGITNEPVVNITSRVTATVGGLPATIQFAGRVSGGLYQINVQIPSGVAPGDQPVRISTLGATSPAGVFLAVQ